MDARRIDHALDRIESAFSRIETVFARIPPDDAAIVGTGASPAGGPMPDSALAEENRHLRATMADAMAEIDQLIRQIAS